MQPEDMNEMRESQDFVNEIKDDWFEAYGFEHDCHCADDIERGLMMEIPLCYADAATRAFNGLRETRTVLRTVAEATTDDVEGLKSIAKEAFAS